MIVTNKTLNKVLWWAVFVAATMLTSRFIHQFKVFTLSPGMTTGLTLLLVVSGILFSLLYMMYDTYVDDKHADKIKHPFSLFEWIYRHHSHWLLKSKAPNGVVMTGAAQ